MPSPAAVTIKGPWTLDTIERFLEGTVSRCVWPAWARTAIPGWFPCGFTMLMAAFLCVPPRFRSYQAAAGQ